MIQSTLPGSSSENFHHFQEEKKTAEKDKKSISHRMDDEDIIWMMYHIFIKEWMISDNQKSMKGTIIPCNHQQIKLLTRIIP